MHYHLPQSDDNVTESQEVQYELLQWRPGPLKAGGRSIGVDVQLRVRVCGEREDARGVLTDFIPYLVPCLSALIYLSGMCYTPPLPQCRPECGWRVL